MNPYAIGVISSSSSPRTISVTIPGGTDRSAIVANFTTTSISVKVGNITQVSGVTVNNFTNPVDYTVTAQDGSTAQYTVTVPYPVLYISNYGANSVSVLNGLNGGEITTLDVGSQPAGIGVNPVTKKIYVANMGGYSVSVINGITNTIQTTINLTGSDPHMVGVNPILNKIYVAYQYYMDYVEVIDGASDTLLTTLEMSGNSPVGIGINPNTNKVYIVLWGDSSVDVWTGTTNSYFINIDGVISYELGGIAVNPVTNKIYVPDVTYTVQVINGASDSVTKLIDIGSETAPISVAINTITNRVYTANHDNNTLSVIDGNNDTLMISTPVGNSPNGIAVSEKHNLVYVVNSADNTISVVDGETNAVLDTVSVGNNPFFIGILE